MTPSTATIEPPQPPDGGPSEPPGTTLLDNSLYENFTLSRARFAGQFASRVAVTQAHLKRVDLSGTIFDGLRLRDVRLSRCDLAAALWRQTEWRRVIVDESRLLGWQCIDGKLEAVRFRGCALDSAMLRMARLQRVRFDDCTLREADFYGADLTGVIFRGCDMRGASLLKATLAGADLRGCDVGGVAISPEGLPGLIIEPEQAVDIIRSTGVVLEYLRDDENIDRE